MEAPSQAITAWLAEIVRQFVPVGRGHDVECSARFLMALRRVDPNMAVNIEHKDFELDQLEGLHLAADNLNAAYAAAGL